MREHSGEFLYLRWVWVDVGIDPYEFFRGFRKNRGAHQCIFDGSRILEGDCDRRESPEGAHQCERHFAMASG